MRAFCSAVILAFLVSGCATLRGPVAEEGPSLTVRNEGFSLLDLAYRCTENGPVTTLGSVRGQTVETFVLKPAFCSTVYLIRRPTGIQPLGLDRKGEQAFASVVLSADGTATVVFTVTGVMLRKDSADVARSDSEP
jgi:hypothetical protein